MTRVLFRKASKSATTGIWLAKVNADLREFCPKAYGTGIRLLDKHLNGFGIRTYALNLCGYSLQFWHETK